MATGLRLQFVKHGAYGWNKGHAGVAGSFAEFVVQAGKQQAFPEVKVGGVIDGRPVTVGQAEHAVVGKRSVNRMGKPLRESRKYSASTLPMRLRRNPIRMLLSTS